VAERCGPHGLLSQAQLRWCWGGEWRILDSRCFSSALPVGGPTVEAMADALAAEAIRSLCGCKSGLRHWVSLKAEKRLALEGAFLEMLHGNRWSWLIGASISWEEFS